MYFYIFNSTKPIIFFVYLLLIIFVTTPSLLTFPEWKFSTSAGQLGTTEVYNTGWSGISREFLFLSEGSQGDCGEVVNVDVGNRSLRCGVVDHDEIERDQI
jgi:hypothetical protein